MKPSFALVLTQDTIALLHRTSQGWQPVGEAAVSDPDLTEALGFLRQSALGLDPRGVTSKLVIPNSEILYRTVQAPGPSASARRSQIRAALEGVTPYAVRDLVFDWSGKGPVVQVAVVARETLQEAESFASQHRLGPVSFVGSPAPGMFDGEPWFGPAAAAENLIGPGVKVERDHSPVPVPASAVADLAAVAAPDTDAIKDYAEPVSDPADPTEVVAAVGEVVPLAATAPPDLPAAQHEAPEPVANTAGAEVPEPTETAPAPEKAEAVQPDDIPAATATSIAAATATSASPLPRPLPPPGLVADPVPPPFARSSRADVIAQSLDVPPEDLPAIPARGPVVASSAPAVERLKARLAEQPIDPRRFGGASSGPGAVGQSQAADAASGRTSGTPASAARNLTPAPGTAAPLVAPARMGAPSIRPTAARVVAKGGTRGAASMVTSPSIPIPRDRRVNIPAAEAASDARAKAAVEARKTQKPDADNLTSFGAKQIRRGKPKYLGLILTGVLLVLLAAVAAWSSYVASDSPPDAVPVAATPAPPDLAESVASSAPAAEPVAPEPSEQGATVGLDAPQAVRIAREAMPANDVSTDPVADVGDVRAVAVAAAATDAAPVEERAPRNGTEGAAAATLATSGSPAVAAPTEAAIIAQPEVPATTGRTPPVTPQDEIFLAMTDPAVPIADLIALAPPIASADPAPGPQPLPPPFGTVYRFDANGLILPTPEGIVTPEGVVLVLGKPSRVPPARPSSPALPVEQVLPVEQIVPPEQAAIAESPESTGAAAASVAGVISVPVETASDGPASDPALAGARPRSRPADLVPDPGDDAALAQSVDTQLTSLLPRSRPQALIAEAEAAAEAAAVQSASASLASTAAESGQISPFAVAISLKPPPRPRDFSRAVEAAVASIEQPPVTAPEEPVQVAAVPEPRPTVAPGAIPQAKPAKPAPAAKPKEPPPEDEIDEPEVASAAPDLPTRANVAKQATFRNAINLSRINLIGVYGSSSNRYALVRQPNGRYIKVEVGDRVDGGKVAAISERELRYVKNGRTVTLAMPKG